MRFPWRPDQHEVRDLQFSETFYVVHPHDGVLAARRGMTPRDVDVFAVTQPTERWLVLMRGIDIPEGIHGEIVLEVDGGADVTDVDKHVRFQRSGLDIIHTYLDMGFHTDRETAQRHVR